MRQEGYFLSIIVPKQGFINWFDEKIKLSFNKQVD